MVAGSVAGRAIGGWATRWSSVYCSIDRYTVMILGPEFGSVAPVPVSMFHVVQQPRTVRWSGLAPTAGLASVATRNDLSAYACSNCACPRTPCWGVGKSQPVGHESHAPMPAKLLCVVRGDVNAPVSI